MFRHRLTLFKLFGLEVRVDASWVFLAALVAWSLAAGYFPSRVPGLGAAACWLLGLAGALGLFASIVFHELCHSLVAQARGMTMGGITLFVFGGVAEMGDEPPDPATEFWMAAAGPASSALLGWVLLAAASFCAGLPALHAFFGYLGTINLLLAAFNLVPGFPLDGGRMLRAGLWRWSGDFLVATRRAAAGGRLFGGTLIALGAFAMAGGRFMGAWWILLGLFLLSAARSAHLSALLRGHLKGEPVRRFMRKSPAVEADASVRELVDRFLLGQLKRLVPVEDHGRLLGCVTAADVRRVPASDWDSTPVRQVARPATKENTVSPGSDVYDAMRGMQGSGRSGLLVADDGHVLGVLAIEDLMLYTELRLGLGGPPGPDPG